MPRPAIYWLTVTGFGSGAAPRAPGTFGSLAAVLIVVALDSFFQFPWWGTGALALIAGFGNVLLGHWIQREMGEDPPSVVIDEFAGQWIALTVPFRAEEPLLVYIVAFGLFRFFDILKPLGISAVEKLPLGWGVLMDDVLAGVYALASLIGVYWLVDGAL